MSKMCENVVKKGKKKIKFTNTTKNSTTKKKKKV